jgi:NTE family protein
MLFEPIEIDGKMLLDGGILNNFPIEPLIGKCEKIIGVHVNSLSNTLEHMEMKDFVDRSYHLSVRGVVTAKQHLCDLFIEPPSMSRFGVLNIEAADEIFEWGYKYARGMQTEIEALKESLNES